MTVFGGFAFADNHEEFLFLDEIRIGMSGIGKTIIAGDVIEEFSAVVLGIIDQPGTLSDFIVVRVSGEVIGRAGGIAQGMSGSPIYIDGKLIGALSRAAIWSKEITPIGLVTPIEPMLAVLDSTRSAASSASAAPDAVLSHVRLVAGDHPPAAGLLASASPDTIYSFPVSAPLIATGLSGRSREILMTGMPRENLSVPLVSDLLGRGIVPEVRGLSSLGLSLLPLAGSGPAGAVSTQTLQAGGSIGVALTTGDISIGSLGTITHRDDDALIAYGHPFIENGASAFPLTSVSIIDTLKSLQASFKLGTLGESVGTALEDRTAAVGGRLGASPALVEVSWEVADTEPKHTEIYALGMVDEPRLTPDLLLASGFHAIDTTLDRVGQGTVEVAYRIEGDGLSSPLERTDIFLSTTDVAVYPPWQLASIVSYLQYNAFEDPKIHTISASMRVTEEIRAVRITGLSIDRPFYYPGETIEYEVRLQTFQGEQFVERGSLRIPHDLVSDVVVIRAYGGPRYLESSEAVPEFESLEDLVDAIEGIPSYDQLTVELFAYNYYSVDPGGLFGVTEETFAYPGFVVYDERSVAVPLGYEEEEAPSVSPSGKSGG
jgi:hypothetical protein